MLEREREMPLFHEAGAKVWKGCSKELQDLTRNPLFYKGQEATMLQTDTGCQIAVTYVVNSTRDVINCN